jgi:uncharacterized protein (DUF2141 family)
MINYRSLLIGILAVSPFSYSAEIRVEIQNCTINKPVLLALYNSSAGFPGGKESQAFKVLSVMAEQNSTLTVFPDVPAGRYALAVYADLNDNQKLDLNLMRIPKEPYGFSRDARNAFTPPSFEQAAFEVPEGGTLQKISLK